MVKNLWNIWCSLNISVIQSWVSKFLSFIEWWRWSMISFFICLCENMFWTSNMINLQNVPDWSMQINNQRLTTRKNKCLQWSMLISEKCFFPRDDKSGIFLICTRKKMSSERYCCKFTYTTIFQCNLFVIDRSWNIISMKSFLVEIIHSSSGLSLIISEKHWNPCVNDSAILGQQMNMCLLRVTHMLHRNIRDKCVMNETVRISIRRNGSSSRA